MSISFAQEKSEIEVTVDLNTKYQTIDNFGASDAWSVKFVGNWPDAKRKALAELLFSTRNTKAGQPKGIGLSLWRLSLGAGSTEQGTESAIKDEWRREESFLDENGRYDWSKNSAQTWFIKEAKKYGVNQFLGFFNSPPVNFTKNGKAFSDDGLTNLSPDKYPIYSNYILNVIKGLNQHHQINLNYISPVNEPQWDWKNGSQEGSPYTNTEIASLIKVLNDSLQARQLETKIIIPESGKLNYLFEDADKPGRGSQINYFFNDKRSSIAHLPSVANIVAGHSYFTTSPYIKAVQLRERLKAEVDKINGLKYWMSEYCILGDNDGEINGSKVDLGIDPALYLAKVIHNDLVNANATAWQWWLAISPYNYKDGLISIDKNKDDGTFKPTKMLWVLGNYSRFIRPGFIRVKNQIKGNDSLQCSSFIDTKDKQLVNVIINSTDVEKTIKFSVLGGSFVKPRLYQTSANGSLTPIKGDKNGIVIIPAKTVTTLLSYY